MRTLARVHCRDYIHVLRCMPRNAAKRFPTLTARQAADRARRCGDTDLISAANANTCLANLSIFLNRAVNGPASRSKQAHIPLYSTRTGSMPTGTDGGTVSR